MIMSEKKFNYLDEDGFRKEDHLVLMYIEKEKAKLEKELQQVNEELKLAMGAGK